MTLAIRVANNNNAGLGHFFRCLNLRKKFNFRAYWFLDNKNSFHENLINKKDKIYYESKENSCGKLKSFIKKNKTSFIIFDSNWLNDFKISQLRKLSRVIVLSDVLCVAVTPETS